MIEWEQTMEVKILRRQGYSLRQIAHEARMSVNTVRKYLKNEGKPCYKERPPKATKLSPYYEYLRQRVKGAHPLWIPATVLLREIQEQGYKGGISQLKYYLMSLKPASPQEDVIRFETPPGLQMQVDWIEFRKGKAFLAAFVATLGYSRASYVRFVTDERLETLMECHKQAFDYFGGVPRQVLYDNMKTVILERNVYGPGKHRFHPTFLDFARHYGFQLKVCRPYRAKTKGKVERFNRYLRQSFYNPLSSQYKMAGLILEADDANQDVLKWLRDVANVRLHGTTNAIPYVRLQEEQQHLQPLPRPYCGVTKRMLYKPAKKKTKSKTFYTAPLQHPLTIYQQILEAVQ